MNIHPTAIVHSKAILGEGTRIGPFSTIGENVVLGKNCDIQEHVVVRGLTTFGDNCKIFPGAVVGAEPQHLGYKGEPTTVQIGNNVTLRECVTVHRGTLFGHSTTRIGNNSYIMAYAHIAHDCVIGNHVIVANSVQLAGHCEIHDYVIFGGASAMAQHCRIGRYCYIGGGSIVRKDVPPFVTGKGTDFSVQAINTVGLTRQGFSAEKISQLRKMFKIFFLQNLTSRQAIDKIGVELGMSDEIKVFVDFIQESKLGVER
jgi:UDP-N-acetylglucosamine acyltransferase